MSRRISPGQSGIVLIIAVLVPVVLSASKPLTRKIGKGLRKFGERLEKYAAPTENQSAPPKPEESADEVKRKYTIDVDNDLG